MANDHIEVKHLKELPYFHPDLDRHKAEAILLQNGEEGTFLVRNSSRHNEYAVSVRSVDAVKHFQLFWKEDGFEFGHGQYETCADLERHFSSKPLLAGESAHTTLLCEPYPRVVEEPNIYEAVRVHAEGGNFDENKIHKHNFSINSKGGYLTKLGAIFKNWKVRYFKLQGSELSYFKDTSSKVPLRVLDLDQCLDCKYEGDVRGKDFVFSLVFSWRTFYLFGKNEDESREWVERIQWRLDNVKKS